MCAQDIMWQWHLSTQADSFFRRLLVGVCGALTVLSLCLSGLYRMAKYSGVLYELVSVGYLPSQYRAHRWQSVIATRTAPDAQATLGLRLRLGNHNGCFSHLLPVALVAGHIVRESTILAHIRGVLSTATVAQPDMLPHPTP